VRQRTPPGLVAAIVLWNFPVVLLALKLAPALFAGNMVVAKLAPTTPLTALLLGEICKQVLPAGTINIIVDDNDLGGALSGHADVAKVAFTGSTTTGKKVMAIPNLRPLNRRIIDATSLLHVHTSSLVKD
jgi:acyl-CoA reductase-like NAD-dependent aldehyde dehydrogenase